MARKNLRSTHVYSVAQKNEQLNPVNRRLVEDYYSLSAMSEGISLTEDCLPKG